jgi:hypothetical protein
LHQGEALPIVFCLPFGLAGFALLAVFCFALLGAGCALPVAFDLSLVLGALLADQVLGLPGCFAGCWVLPFLWGCLSVSAENHAAKPINGLLSGFFGVLLPGVHQ